MEGKTNTLYAYKISNNVEIWMKKRTEKKLVNERFFLYRIFFFCTNNFPIFVRHSACSIYHRDKLSFPKNL